MYTFIPPSVRSKPDGGQNNGTDSINFFANKKCKKQVSPSLKPDGNSRIKLDLGVSEREAGKERGEKHELAKGLCSLSPSSSVGMSVGKEIGH